MEFKIPQLKILRDFRSFLFKHGVVGLAVGVVIGAAVGKLVQALVQDLIMPIVGFLTPSGNWRKLTFDVGPVKFAIGDFIGSVLDFGIVAFIVFLIVHVLMRQRLPYGMKHCPECLETVPSLARKCKFCTTTFDQ